MITIKKNKYLVGAMFIIVALTSCKKFATIGVPAGSVDASVVYNNDATATAGILALYSNVNYVQGMAYATLETGMAADEMNTIATNSIYTFQTNTYTPADGTLASLLWLYPYQEINYANVAIANMKNATTLTPLVKSQLIGEAEFWRAHAYLSLINYFGAVPLYTSTDPTINAVLPRSPSTQVYGQIISDLKDAKSLLATTYSGYAISQRARVNQYAVSALLARTYLYTKDWVNAEAEATAVMGSNVYSLSTPDQTFLNTSSETILQLYVLSGVTQLGPLLVPSSATSYTYYLAPGFVNAFETGDKRLTNWVAPIGTTGLYHVNKYKIRVSTAGNEYYVVLRLAEQYLIRAEARAQQNNVPGALADLNAIRARAGLAAKTGLNQAQTLLAIEQERKVELFAEYCHRWFDLKRTPSLTSPTTLSRADDILKPIKTAWKPTAVLFPINAGQIIQNPNLLPQNPGY